jgi:rod shape-determining protein MreD
MSVFRTLALLLMLYAALLADTVAAPHLQIGRVSPDCSSLVIVAWVLRATASRAVVMAAVAGLVCDLAMHGRVGPGVLACAITALAVARWAPKLPTRIVGVEAAVIGVATLFVHCLLSVAAVLTGEAQLGFAAWSVQVFGAAVYTSAVSVPILMVQNWLAGDAGRWQWRHAA